MNIQIQHYDRILLVHIEETITEPDLMQLAGLINSLASKIGTAVVDVHRAQIEPSVAGVLTKLKKQYEKSKIRFLIVSPDLIGADSGTLLGAIEAIGSTESARIIELFEADAEFKQLQLVIAKARGALIARLGLKEGAEPIAKGELDTATRVLEEKNRQLLQLFKTFSSEIHRLERQNQGAPMPGSDNPDAVRVAESKRRALDVVKASGALD